MKEDIEIEVLENVFELEFGYPDIFYLQRFLFIIGLLGGVFWPIISLLMHSAPFSDAGSLFEPNYFVYGLNSIWLFTLLSRLQQDIWIKKLFTFVNFTIGFMIVSNWLGYDVLSSQGITVLLLYLIASLWIYALVGGLATNPTSYSFVLLMMTPLSVFGTTLMVAKNPFVFFWVLLLFLFTIVLIQTFFPKKLVQILEKLPNYPFLIPFAQERSFLDILNIPKAYIYTLESRKGKMILFLEHIIFFLLTPALLFPAVCLLDLRQVQEMKLQRKLIQHMNDPPIKGMISPEEGARAVGRPVSLVARLLGVIARQRGWRKFCGNIVLFVDIKLAIQEDVEVLELAERLSEVDLFHVPHSLMVILHKVSFAHLMHSHEGLVRLSGLKRESIERGLSELEERGLVRILAAETRVPMDLTLQEILQSARMRYERTFRRALSQVATLLGKNPRFVELSEKTKSTVSLIATKVLLVNSDMFEREFIEVAKKADELFMHSTKLENTITSYQIPVNMQKEVVTSIFYYVRDNIKTRVEEPFGEKVRWPWSTVNEGGDCDCKTVLLASMLIHLGFRVGIVVIPPSPGIGHTFVSVRLLSSKNREDYWWNLDASDYRCEPKQISPEYKSRLDNILFIDMSWISNNTGVDGI